MEKSSVSWRNPQFRAVRAGYHRGMRLVRVGTTFTLSAESPTVAFFRVRPADEQRMSERLQVVGEFGGAAVPVATFADHVGAGPGSHQLVDRALLPTGLVVVTYEALVAAHTPAIVPPTAATGAWR